MARQCATAACLSEEQWNNVDRAFRTIAAAVRSADAREAGLKAAGKKRSDFTDAEWDLVAEKYELRQ